MVKSCYLELVFVDSWITGSKNVVCSFTDKSDT